VNTILFVDDHRASRTVFGEVLRLKGYTVMEAGTTTDVDHIVKHHSGPIDLLVVEAVLSTTNGIEVAHGLHARYPELRVLYISDGTLRNSARTGDFQQAQPFCKSPLKRKICAVRCNSRFVPRVSYTRRRSLRCACRPRGTARLDRPLRARA